MTYRTTPILLALALALLLVVGVLVGSKVVYNKAAHQPVSMAALDSPDADSEQCAALIASLPEELQGHKRAELVEPAPAGAAAWSSSSTERITLRCGVSTPLQYSSITPLEEHDGVQWMRVDDATPGSSLHTWFAVGKSPLVAITADDVSTKEAPVIDLSALNDEPTKPNDIPLAGMAVKPSKKCEALLKALPQELDGMQQAATDQPQTKAWVREGSEPVVLRCGVPFPEAYQPGAQLQQIDGLPWFEDTTLGNGTTASTWYPMGRDVNLAVSMPNGSSVLVDITRVLKRETEALAQ